MNERIERLAARTMRGEMYAAPVPTKFDREDLFLTRGEREVKRLCEYIRNQEPVLCEDSAFTGYFNCDGSIVGDAMRRGGHPYTQRAMREFFLQAVDNLSTMEWQHATANYRDVLDGGFDLLYARIARSMQAHEKPEELEFLRGLRDVLDALVDWTDKCAARAEALAQTVHAAEQRANLTRLADALRRVPRHKPRNFYEAVLTIYVCFSADPDSLGTLDRYLRPFYERDLAAGTLTRAQAGAYLQELFLMVQASTERKSPNFTRGGESHFCVGGYLENGEDGFCDLSRLILERLVELPVYFPQVSLRWTRKTPREVLRFVMDCERHDAHKRIAFVSDEKRLRAFTEICGFPYDYAVGYTMVGCNEPAFPGAITGSNSKVNILRCVETLFHKKADVLRTAPDFEAFYRLFERELTADYLRALDYDNKYNLERAKDVNYLSSPFFNDCIENARSLTQGGGNRVVVGMMLIGIPNVIDSLSIVKQFVFDEKAVSLDALIDAVQNDWRGYEDLRAAILKKGCFFGNGDATSNGVARRFYDSLYRLLKGRRNVFGYPLLVGDLVGYHPHGEWFGEKTAATPDGRKRGDRIKFGLGQGEGKDRAGLTALLHAVATADETGVSCGATVTNVNLDVSLVRNDASFEKTVDLFETYFRLGGTHFQLNYVSPEELRAAKQKPQEHKNLRVRVSGFSDYFVRLSDNIQDEIIARTEKHA